jgi:hypothetical protein
MRRIRSWWVLHLQIATVALACHDGTGPIPLSNARYQYTIAYSDSGPQEYAGTFGGFWSYLNLGGPSNGLWAAVYSIGDSLEVTEILPSGVQCPVARTVPVGTHSGAADSATVIVRHRRITGTGPDPNLSTLTIDSLGSKQVWGEVFLSLRPEFPNTPSATITGHFSLPETQFGTLLRHCIGAA